MDYIKRFAVDSFSERREVYTINNYLRHNLSTNTPFTRFLIASVDRNRDIFEVPIMLKDNCNIANKTFNSAVLVCNSRNSVETRRLATTILGRFINADNSDRLICVRTNKGDKYYGGKGIILDKDFNPILILTMRKEGSSIYPVCRISPRAITGSGIMENLIKNKIIPLYCSEDAVVNYINVGFNHERTASFKVKIIIEDCDYFITKPTVPKPSLCSDEAFHKFLSSNANYVVDEP